jgi:ligand-binding sensor domain-containing protein
MLSGSGRIILLDADKGSIIGYWKFPNALGAIMLNDGDLLVTTGRDKELFLFDTAASKTKANYGVLKDSFGKTVEGYFRYLSFQADGKVVITTGYDGIVTFDPLTKSTIKYSHDPLDVNSISGNNTYKISSDKDGFVFVTSRSSGLSFYNCYWQKANTQKFFKEKGNDRIFDGFVGSLAEDSKGNIWLGTQGGLIQWDPVSRKSSFAPYGVINGQSIAGKEEIRALHFDKSGRLWVGLNRYGIVVLDKDLQPVRYFNANEKDIAKKLPANFILDIKEGPDGHIWVGTIGGFCIIDPEKMQVIKPANFNELNSLPRIRTGPFYFGNRKDIWIATSRGAAKYDVTTRKLTWIKTEQGLSDGLVLAIGGDELGNRYFGTKQGVQKISPAGEWMPFSLDKQIAEESCVGIKNDTNGYVWIASDNYLTCYFPMADSFSTFDLNSGFAGNGFRFNAHMITKDGRLFWGCNEGVSWFQPNDLLRSNDDFGFYTAGIQAGNKNIAVSSNVNFNLDANANTVTFEVVPVSLSGNRFYKYQYRLKGLDNEWQVFNPIQLLPLPPLSPGEYQFEIRYSKDGKAWKPGSNTVSIKIAPHWWQKGWIQLMAVLLLCGLGGGLLASRAQKKRAENQAKEMKRAAELEMEEWRRKAAEVEMQALRAQMNPHFMFNSLNSINNFILNSDIENASSYLTRFSRLMRLILDNSRHDWVPLEQELHALELYIGMESLRFDNAFSWHISTGEGINIESAQIPPLLIQPYVENAIWHGLMHRKLPGGHLKVSLFKKDDILFIEIEDNGVGRTSAAKLKQQVSGHKKSHGMNITFERIGMINRVYDADVQLSISDKKDKNGQSDGTLVQLQMRYRLHYQAGV